MSPVTAKQQSFIETMRKSDELKRKGFQVLLQRADYALFFDMLQEATFFMPTENPAPVAGEKENSVRIPYWGALDYLKAVASLAGTRNNIALATKVMDVVRAVSIWRDENNEPRRNYHTHRIFAEILGLVPTAAVTVDDIGLLREWLNDPYDRMLVAHELDKGILPRLLDSIDSEDWNKAAQLLYQVTAIDWVKRGGEGEADPRSVVDDFSLGELLTHHARNLGRKAGSRASAIMIDRIREVFGTPMRRYYSDLFRPAIEDNAQNHQWRSAENRVIEGLREVLLGWSEEEPTNARAAVEGMLRDDLQIVGRVGVYVLAQRWASMRDLYCGNVITALLNSGHSYELYHLLQDHFIDMNQEQKSATLRAIETLPSPTYVENPERVRRQHQYRWLSTIKGKGCEDADRAFAERDSDPNVGKLGDHPDFDSYISGGFVGPGPTPFSPEELAALTQANALSEKLNTYKPTSDWQGPTTDGLAAALGQAVCNNPDIFLIGLSQILYAKPIYQQAVVNSLKGAWESKASANWGKGWDQLVSFFEQLMNSEQFRQLEDEKYQHWAIVSAIADTLNAGTKQDEHAYDASLLPRTQVIITRLLEQQFGAVTPDDDAMMQALNTSKGRVIEALYSHALRAARISDKQAKTHREAWEAIRPVFEAELTKCVNANYEFSTLAGAYLPQLQYLDLDWTREQLDRIFPTAYESNTVCALDGLSYAAFTRPVYELIAEHGIIDRALTLGLKGRNTREKLLERIALAYLWGIESIDGEHLTKLFRTAKRPDVDVLIRVFWMVRNNDLTPEQRERILSFWERVQTWEQDQDKESVTTSSLLAAYITTLNLRELRLLETVAPTVHVGHETYEFTGELLRLAPQDPAGITRVLQAMMGAHLPDYDYEDRLGKLLEVLADHGQRAAVIVMSNQLRHLPTAKSLYKRLTD